MVDCSCRRQIPFFNMKFHYFLFNAASVCVLPFLPLHAKDIGISAFSLGIIYSIFPLITMVLKPFFGAVADHFNSLKSFLFVFLFVIMLSSMMIISIPRKTNPLSSEIRCTSFGTRIYFKSKPTQTCRADELLCRSVKCHMYCSECLSLKSVPPGKNNSIDKVCTKKAVHITDALINLQKGNGSVHYFNVKSLILSEKEMNLNCSVNLTFSCNSICEPVLQDCFVGKASSQFNNEQFWLFFIFAMIYVSLTGVVSSFSDAVCFNELGERGDLYGRQRLWGTVGWGLFSPIAGFLNDLVTPNSVFKEYMPGAMLLVILIAYDAAMIDKLKTKNLKVSQNVIKDVRSLLSQFKIISFMISVLVVGSFTPLVWSFLFWHLDTLGANKTILGIVSAFQCFLGELVFFFFSNKIINTLGYFNVLTLNFISFSLRFFAYSFITDPWMVLPIELLQGPTYGLFYATMASFAHDAALPGTEVTVQGLVGSAFELGMTTGNLLGGYSMQQTDGKFTYFYAGVIAILYVIINVIFTCISKYIDKKAIRARDLELSTPAEEDATFM